MHICYNFTIKTKQKTEFMQQRVNMLRLQIGSNTRLVMVAFFNSA